MHNDKTVQRFMELRVQGWVFARIAAELNVAKNTLIDWSRRHQHTIANLIAIEYANAWRTAPRGRSRTRQTPTSPPCLPENMPLHGPETVRFWMYYQGLTTIASSSPVKDPPSDFRCFRSGLVRFGPVWSGRVPPFHVFP